MSRTLRMARSVLTADFAFKLLRRARRPGMFSADFSRLAREVRRDGLRMYARYHQRRHTPGRVFRIPGRQCRMWLPIAWGETVAQRRFGLFEPDTFETLTRIVRPGAVVLELGACYGEFTIHLSKLAGPHGHVYSFEPLPKYFEIARRNVALNRLTNVELMNQAAGTPDMPDLRIAPDDNPYAFINQISGLAYAHAAPANPQASGVTIVPCVSLRQFIQDRGIEPDVIFMDIEGCELQVIPDLAPFLSGAGKRPLIYFELHPQYYRPGLQIELEGTIHECHYRMERLANHLLCTPEPLTRDR